MAATGDTTPTCGHTASTTPTWTPPTTPKLEPERIDSWTPSPGPRTSTPIAPAQPARLTSNPTMPTANAPTSPQRKLAHTVSDSTLLLTILAHFCPPACVYIAFGAGCSFLLNVAITEVQPELGTFHAWYLICMFFRNADADDTMQPDNNNNNSAMQRPIGAWRGGIVSAWPEILCREFPKGFQNGIQKSLEKELLHQPPRGIRIEVQYEGIIDEAEGFEDSYDEIAGSLRDLSREMAEVLQEMKELLARVRRELRKL